MLVTNTQICFQLVQIGFLFIIIYKFQFRYEHLGMFSLYLELLRSANEV